VWGWGGVPFTSFRYCSGKKKILRIDRVSGKPGTSAAIGKKSTTARGKSVTRKDPRKKEALWIVDQGRGSFYSLRLRKSVVR